MKKQIFRILSISFLTISLLFLAFIARNPVIAAEGGANKKHVVTTCECADESSGYTYTCGESENQDCNEIGGEWFPTCSACYRTEDGLCDPDDACNTSNRE